MENHSHIPDIQSSADERNIKITRVGIRDIRLPLAVRVGGEVQHTVASAELTVGLASSQKGTHMSRFVQLLHEQGAIGLDNLRTLHQSMLSLLKAVEGSIELSFPLFLMKRAPVSGVESLMDYDVSWFIDGGQEDSEIWVEVCVPVTSLCPCSKEISKYGAHNQRSHVIISALYDEHKPFSIEELVSIAEEASSCPMWATLKRPDEKYVTERAYENPKFVEDIVRDVAVVLNADERVQAYRVSSENFESIHNHSAYAIIEFDKRGGHDD